MAYRSFVDPAQSALPRNIGSSVEGMGDFASGTSTSKLWSPRGILKGLGTGARGVGRMAIGPVPLAVAALQPLASATANRQVQSGQYTEPGVTKALPGAFPRGAIDTRGISNTNPFTGNAVTNYANKVQPDTTWNPSTVKPAVAPWIANPDDWTQERTPAPNSIPPLDPHGFATVGGNRINYGDIGNPLKDAALINSTGYSFGTTPADSGGAVGTNQGGTNLSDLLKIIQSVQPVQDYASRVGALSTGNTTWDMDPLQKILAAKAGHQADTERYQQQTGALTNLGTAQMQSEASRYGHEAQARSEEAKNRYLAPYYAGQTEKNVAEAGAAPLRAKADVLKALTEQAKENPTLKAAMAQLDKYGAAGNVEGFNDYAAKIAMLTGKRIPPMLAQE